MKFVKRLIIMSGENNKGTLSLERNAYGVFGKLNTFGSPLVDAELVMKIDGKTFTQRPGRGGGSFTLAGAESIDLVHAVVFCSGRTAMYGTNEQKRLSIPEIEALKPKHSDDGKLFSSRKAGDYFLKIGSTDKDSETADGQADTITESAGEAVDFDLSAENTVEAEYAADREVNASAAEATVQNAQNGEYQDERLADENYYPQSVNNDAPSSAAENHVSRALRQDSFAELGKKTLSQAGQKGFLSAKKGSEYVGADALSEVAAAAAPQTKNQLKPRRKPVVDVPDDSPAMLERAFLLNKACTLSDLSKATASTSVAATAAPMQKQNTYNHYNNPQGSAKHKPPQTNRGGGGQSGSRGGSYGSVRNYGRGYTQHPRENYNGERVDPIKNNPHVSARQGTFFERNGEEIERLFASGPRESLLEKLLPGSKWVKVDYDQSGKHYVVGMIGNQFLCYGVPSKFTPQPPEELKGYCWWLPVNAKEPEGKGYWIMYQNLMTGETVFPDDIKE